ncbi:MAG: 4-hydroxy-3-methylbut-2-enyl diphosphate reductase [Candidatus Atribacteria bacterium]|nr:4-hydroxy-3-methylbut-2-enyl diphosphate reductase [Candidatus Atribacteria bacterium]
MEIIRANHIGFCYGVKRAIKLANQLLSEANSDDIYMLGEIIHNPQVVKSYQDRGIHVVDDVSEVPAHKYLITRAHGILKGEKKIARERQIKLIDTTCPYVSKLRKIAVLLKSEGYHIFIFGDTNHPEIKSLLSYIDTDVKVVQSLNEISSHHFANLGKIGLISQTTKDYQKYLKIAMAILKHVDELRIYNTICKATALRQDATRKLAKQVEIMIVVGGFNSANTTRLANISKQLGVPTFHIETEKQLKKEWFKGKQKIGITSGASTPDFVTESIIQKIKLIC